jgi:AcrR family transcriptional regulator
LLCNCKINGITTKERIIHETLKLVAQKNFEDISLSEIAKSVGITKPGIFRHFKNKEELLLETENYFYDSVSQLLQEIHKNTKEELFEGILLNLFSFLLNHEELFLYFIKKLVADSTFIEKLKANLEQRDLKVEALCKGHPTHIFTGVTIFFFILQRIEKIKTLGELATPSVEEYVKNIWAFLNSGWKEIQALDEEKIKELDEIAKIKEDEFPEKNKFFSALAEVIVENGIPGVTIEKMATKLGMAKSSLYSTFKNKDDLVTKLVKSQLLSMSSAINKRAALMKTASEVLYVQMKTQLEYFLHQEEIIPICGWLRLQAGNEIEEMKPPLKEGKDFWEHLATTFPDFGMKFEATSLVSWISLLVISMIIHGRKYGLSDLELRESISDFHYMIGHGVKFRRGFYE